MQVAEPPDGPDSDPVRPTDTRLISDVDSARALAHPVRVSLLEALLSGPLSATQAGAIVGQSATTCSFHLRQLAKYGFVEEAGRGKGRERLWRRIHHGWRVPMRADDDEFVTTSRELHMILLDRYFDRIRRATLAMADESLEWRQAMLGTESLFWLTSDELREFADELGQVVTDYARRLGSRSTDPEQRPAGARPIEILQFAVPVSPGLSQDDPA